jgi:protease II
VLAFLREENERARRHLGRLQGLQELLCGEASDRYPATEQSVPQQRGGYVYYRARGPGQDYWDHWRLPAAAAAAAEHGDAAPQLVLDANSLARRHDYLDVGCCQVGKAARQLPGRVLAR